MLTVLSPSKTMNPEAEAMADLCTQPGYLRESRQLIRCLRELSVSDLSRMMRISDTLAERNHARYRDWKTPFTPLNARPAALLFRGDVYTGLAVDTFDVADLRFAQRSLRILSGLYGLLRPLDLIQPYRLEMGTKLATSRGRNLYEFWGARLAEDLDAQIREQGGSPLINLASQEYFRAIPESSLQESVITPVFKERRDGRLRIIGLYAKKARGMMANYIVRNRIEDASALTGFTDGGYRFAPELSSEREWIFLR